jgi:hypothetical protein
MNAGKNKKGHTVHYPVAGMAFVALLLPSGIDCIWFRSNAKGNFSRQLQKL